MPLDQLDAYGGVIRVLSVMTFGTPGHVKRTPLPDVCGFVGEYNEETGRRV